MFQPSAEYNPTLPEARPRLNLQLTLVMGETNEEAFSLTLEIPVMQKVLDPSKGEVYQPLYIAPPATLNFSESCFVFTDAHAKGKEVAVKVRAFRHHLKGRVSLDLPQGWRCEPAFRNVSLNLNQEEQLVTFTVIPPAGKRSNQQQMLKAKIETDGQLWHQSFTVMEYPHIPRLVQFNPAEAILMEVQVENKIQRVGYISGAGDKIPQALKECGIVVEEITEATILNHQLSRYQAIVTGIRAWNTEQRLKTWHPALLNYVKEGGVLVVQYNTTNGLLIPEPGPYPMLITRERTTDEAAVPVWKIPEDAALTYPNRMTERDFHGWVQERGLYYAESSDPHYRMPLAFADPGEPEKKGSLLIADYGKGRFIYTGLAFFRQLPAGVPGAYRLFLNLLHPPK